MGSSSLEAVIERIESLERQRSQLLWAGGIVFSIAVALMAWQIRGFHHRGTVEAERFVLKDSDGKIRGTLGTASDGSPSLALLDGRGSPQVRLETMGGDKAGLSLLEDGRLQASLSSTFDGNASFRLFDQRGRASSGFFVRPDGTAGLRMHSGEQSINLSARLDGKSGLVVAGKTPDERQVFGTTQLAADPRMESEAEPTTIAGAGRHPRAVLKSSLRRLGVDRPAAPSTDPVDHPAAEILNQNGVSSEPGFSSETAISPTQ